MESAHPCRYRDRIVWSEWLLRGTLRERTARRVPTCEECGREQPARRPRTSIFRDEEAVSPEQPPLLDEAGAVVGEVLARRTGGGEGSMPARGLFGRMAARGVTASQAELWLERFMRAGFIRLTWREPESRELSCVTVLDAAAIENLVHPGDRAARAGAVKSALALLEGLDHPVVTKARSLLLEEAGLSVDLARALAAVSRHAAMGEILAERVFSARHLGSSKALGRLRGAIERRLGPLEGLGIREGGALTLVGGRGRLLVPGAVFDLERLAPYVGLSRETVLAMTQITAPPSGLVAVENLAAFEACCRGEVGDLVDSMYVCTAGYPGRGVRAVVEAAARAGASVRAWCDLDLDGIQIARVISKWAPGCGYYRMSAADLDAAPQRQLLSERARRAIERELETGPSDDLSATLRGALMAGCWVEQETMLGCIKRA